MWLLAKGGLIVPAGATGTHDWRAMRTLSPQQEALLNRWDGKAVPPRDAATVAILRDGPRGRETFLIRRRATMAFAAGMYVFPGGGIQPSDFAQVPWIGPDSRTWAERLSCPEGLARALVVGAVREVFEETGLLLASQDQDQDGTVVLGETGDMAAARKSLESQEITLAAFLRAHSLCLRADLLSAWAHWITPAFQPRRFDTRFFAAMLPAGQSVGDLATESDSGEWVRIEQALADARTGTMEMMRPTRHTLRQLLAVGDRPVAEVAAGRTITSVEPRLVEIDGVRYIDGPGEEEL